MARKAPLLRGYKALGGSSRKYRTPSGKTISRREYDNRRLKAKGWRNRYEAEKFRTSRTYSRKRDRLENAGRTPRELDIFSDFAAFVRDIDWDRVGELWDQVELERDRESLDNSPDSPLAEVLVLEGIREPDWSWAVGDTPSGTKGRF